MESFALAGQFHSSTRHDRLVIGCAALGFWGILLLAGPAPAGELLVEEAAYYRDVGHQYQVDGQVDQAINAYAKATLSYPGYADAHNDLGVLYEAKGQLALAEAEYLRTLQINPNHPAAHMNLAMLYEMQGNLDQAIPHWQARVRIGPGKNSWVKAAREMLIKYQAKVPEPLRASQAKRVGQIALAYEEGMFYLDRQRWAEAEQAFERVLSLDPTHRGALDGLEKVREKLPTKASRMMTASPMTASRPAAAPVMDEAQRRRQDEVMQREMERIRQEQVAKQAAAEAQRREQERRQQEAQRLMQQANDLAKQAQAMEQRAKSLRQQTDYKPSTGTMAFPSAQAPARTTTYAPPPMRPAAVAEPPEATEGEDEDESGAPRRENLWSKMKFWERWGKGRQPKAPAMPESAPMPSSTWTPTSVPSAARPMAIAPSTQAMLAAPRPVASGPVKPISTQSEARTLADQLAHERQRTRDLMARELYQRGVILYRQGQYARAIEQFQRALSIDPNHRESQQYMRDAQTALAQGQ